MDESNVNRNYRFSLYFTENEKQWLRVLAEEIRMLIMDRKNMVLEALNGRYRRDKKKKDELTETVIFRLTKREKDQLKCLADKENIKPSE